MPVDDQIALIAERHRQRRRELLRPQVTHELLETFTAFPLARENDDVRRVLNFLASLPGASDTFVENDSDGNFFVCCLDRGERPTVTRVGGPFDTEEEALVAIFVRRIRAEFGVDL
jgi:hypothetical protein